MPASQSRRVSRAHVKETLAKAGLVGTNHCVRARKVDVIGDGDDGALAIARIDASGSIGDDLSLKSLWTSDLHLDVRHAAAGGAPSAGGAAGGAPCALAPRGHRMSVVNDSNVTDATRDLPRIAAS